MQQMGRPHTVEHGGAGRRVEEVCGVPARRSSSRTAPAERVDLEAHRRERYERPASDKA
jgi:hypothetical protein